MTETYYQIATTPTEAKADYNKHTAFTSYDEAHAWLTHLRSMNPLFDQYDVYAIVVSVKRAHG